MESHEACIDLNYISDVATFQYPTLHYISQKSQKNRCTYCQVIHCMCMIGGLLSHVSVSFKIDLFFFTRLTSICMEIDEAFAITVAGVYFQSELMHQKEEFDKNISSLKQQSSPKVASSTGPAAVTMESMDEEEVEQLKDKHRAEMNQRAEQIERLTKQLADKVQQIEQVGQQLTGGGGVLNCSKYIIWWQEISIFGC